MNHRVYLFEHVRACIENIWNMQEGAKPILLRIYCTYDSCNLRFDGNTTLSFYIPHSARVFIFIHRQLKFHLMDFFPLWKMQQMNEFNPKFAYNA